MSSSAPSLPWVRYVVPSFNQGRYLKAALDSLLNQSYPYLEVVVVDGLSSDESVQILRDIRDPRLKWVSEKDDGQVDAIQKGLIFPGSPFKYFNWLGSDDLLYGPEVLTRLVNEAEKSHAAVVYGEGEYIDGQGTPLGRYAVGAATHEALSHYSTLCQPSALIEYASFLRVGGLNKRWSSIMDLDLWLRLVTAGCKFVRVPEIISQYRIHKDSKTASFRLHTFREIFALFAERGERVGMTTFHDAFMECFWTPMTGLEKIPGGPVGMSFKLFRKILWHGSRFPWFEKRVSILFRQPRASLLPFTRSYDDQR